ncbi:hypothetical protein TrVE_jg1652 [Triparma verrucosa]|uniref:CG-1 domain-containing protein n=1 Tax=Triparma verrucosa TaxID=1606542 RepID=A0A9W7KXK1_9STRA|nr:hypothetical protein TrVE_jg1652 [Triparma verrucosa]
MTDRWNEILRTGQGRWLSVSELEDILKNTSLFSPPISTSPPPSAPNSGALFVYDRSQTRNYKDDQITWVRKKNSHKVREDHVKLRIEGVNRISGCYVHSATTSSMHRRTYHLLPNEEEERALEEVRRELGVEQKAKNGVVNRAVMKDGTNFFLVLVHYLDTEVAQAVQGATQEGGKKGRAKGVQKPRAKKDTSQQSALHQNAQMASRQSQMQQQMQLQQQQMPQYDPYSHPQYSQYPPPDPRQYPPYPSQTYPPPKYPSPGSSSPLDYNFGLGSFGGADSDNDSLELLMSPLSNLDDMDIPPSPGDRRGRVEVSQQKELKDIIDLMPESIDFKKLDKAKIMITLGESLEGEGGKYVAVFYTIRSDVPDNAKLKAVDLGVSFAECQQLSTQSFKCLAPKDIARKSPIYDLSSTIRRRVVIVHVLGSELTKDIKQDIIKQMIVKQSGGGDSWSFATNQSEGVIEVEGVDGNGGSEEEEEDLDLPAPLPAMASIATALADFPSPPPGVVTGEAEIQSSSPLVNEPSDTKTRKRTASDVRNSNVDNPQMLPPPSRGGSNVTVEDWANEPSAIIEESTVGEDVDRHCKIRFVEKIINTIAGAEEGESIMEDSWSIPTITENLQTQTQNPPPPQSESSGEFGGNFTTSTGQPESGANLMSDSDLDGGQANLALSQTSESSHASSDAHNIQMNGGTLTHSGSDSGSQQGSGNKGSGITSISPTPNDARISNPLDLLDDAELTGMDDDQLDDILDSLLIRMVETLVEMSASDNELQEELNAPDKSGFTLLHYASLYNLQALVPVLLSRGANPDTPTVRGKLTPLHLACGAGNWGIIELLFRHGCAVNVMDSFGQTPSDHAIQNGFEEQSRWLDERSGGDVVQRQLDREKETARKTNQPEMRNQKKQNDQHLMHNAFSNLSLKDKLAINMIVKKQQAATGGRGAGRGGRGRGAGGIGGRGGKSSKGARAVAKVMGNKSTKIEGTIAENDMEDEEETSSKGSKNSGVNSERRAALRQQAKSNYGDEDEDVETSSLKEENLNYFQTNFEEDDEDARSATSLDVSSVFSESDRESLDIAMSLMNQEEIDTLHNDSQQIESNVRSWMLRKNYQTLREATTHLKHSLEEHYGGEKLSKEDGKELVSSLKEVIGDGGAAGGEGEQKGEGEEGIAEIRKSGGSLWEAAGRTGKVAVPLAPTSKGSITNDPTKKKHINNFKNQALASLVIRKNVLGKVGAGRGLGGGRGPVGVGGRGGGGEGAGRGKGNNPP